jgi:CysZ protein
VRNLILEVCITIPLLVLSLVPVLNFITAILLLLVQAYFAGFGNMDYTLERHYGYKESVQFVKEHKGVAIGNGIIFTLMLFIPFIGILVVLPLSVTAATSQTIRFIGNKK